MIKFAFVSGIPASGKSFLSSKVAKALVIPHIEIDNWREVMRGEPRLKEWVDFFWNKDEEEYLTTTTCDDSWENLNRQSEALWPEILKGINEVIKSEKSAIFEGVNILPRLAYRDLKFPGLVLLGDSLEAIFERNKKEPRWGLTEELQRKEAELFFYCERPQYKREAEKYGYPAFSSIAEAETELLKILR